MHPSSELLWEPWAAVRGGRGQVQPKKHRVLEGPSSLRESLQQAPMMALGGILYFPSQPLHCPNDGGGSLAG